MEFVKRFMAEETGADMLEYALVIALVALAAIAALTTFGGGINSGFDRLKTKVDNNVK